MCIILDTNMFSSYLESDEMKPLRNWIQNRGGKIVFSDIGKLGRELQKHRKMAQRLKLHRRAGKVKVVGKIEVARARTELKYLDLKSNDIHILALAKAGNVKLLCSKDRHLHSDFKRVIHGKVYQGREHSHLLTNNGCP